MIPPSSNRTVPKREPSLAPKAKTGTQLHSKIIPPKLGERFAFAKTWQYVSALRKNGTYDKAVSLLGFNPSSRFSNFFALKKLIQTVGLEQIAFVVASGLNPPIAENEAVSTLSRLEWVQIKLDNRTVISKINDIRMAILDSIPKYKLELRTQLDKALQELKINDINPKDIFENDPNTCNQLLTNLLKKAEKIGYRSTGTRSLATIKELFAGGLEDKITALTLVANQFTARDIQVKVLKELFEKIPKEDLEDAINAHYSPSVIEIPIGASGLYRIFFENEKGTKEVALVHKSKTAPEGSYKIYRLTGTMAAIKDVACLEFKTDARTPEETLTTLKAEVKIWLDQQNAKVRHIPLLYSWEPSKKLFCENFPAGDVFEHIAKSNELQREELFRIAAPTLLEYLEDISKQGWVHRDLKPENLLISKDAKAIKVTDFGLMAKKDQKIKSGGTPSYAAPELFNEGVYPHPSQDIYSAARTLTAIRYGTLKPERLKNDKFDDLLNKMLSKNPSERPTAQQALEEWHKCIAKPAPTTSWFRNLLNK